MGWGRRKIFKNFGSNKLRIYLRLRNYKGEEEVQTDKILINKKHSTHWVLAETSTLKNLPKNRYSNLKNVSKLCILNVSMINLMILTPCSCLENQKQP